jgi:hypothetical protein
MTGSHKGRGQDTSWAENNRVRAKVEFWANYIFWKKVWRMKILKNLITNSWKVRKRKIV